MRRILVVDDNALLAENLMEFLADEGYAASFATSAAEALDMPECFDVYVADVRMPLLNGWELRSRLRKRCPNARIIMMSGFAEPGRRPVEDCDVPLPKPVPLPALLERIGAP